MEKLDDVINHKYYKSDSKLSSYYQKQYDEDNVFRKIANSVDLPTDTLKQYTTEFIESANEIKNCKKCKNIMECKNLVSGYVYYPDKNMDQVEFSYVPCKYQKEILKDNEKYLDNIYYFDIPKEIKDASMKNIDTSDKNRFEAIKWINNYINGVRNKGLYLSGNFGCGKTYLLSAMLNEIAKSGKRIAIVYYPEFLRSLKETFNDQDEYKKKFSYIKKVDLLLLDDIGADTVTEWSRDEVLGNILQYRMEENLGTFFTSNLTISELEEHLKSTSREVDLVKARRIIERIKQLTDQIIMISENKRK